VFKEDLKVSKDTQDLVLVEDHKDLKVIKVINQRDIKDPKVVKDSKVMLMELKDI
jgi:hypothetical protein